MNVWKLAQKQAIETDVAFTVLAPMEDVTDTVFRQIVLEQGRPTLFMTEFTNCDGLQSRGREKVIHRLAYTPEQLPIVAQVWGQNPTTYAQTIPLLVELGFPGVDINMGCPVPNVIKNKAGSGLIKEKSLALEIIHSVREAIQQHAPDDFALSVKTRIGFSDLDWEWITLLLNQQLDAVTFHLRTTKEMSKVPAHWELMSDIVRIKDDIAPATVLIGNGDITTKEQLKTYRKQFGIDGLMVGRGIFSNLWLFSKSKDCTTVSPREKVMLLKQHLLAYQLQWGKNKNFDLMKKFFKVYLQGFAGAGTLRDTLNPLKSIEEMIPIIDSSISNFPS